VRPGAPSGRPVWSAVYTAGVSDAGEIVQLGGAVARAPRAVAAEPAHARRRAPGRPIAAATHAAAVAVGSFVAGAAVVGLAQRLRRHPPGAVTARRGSRARLGRRRARAGGEIVQIVGTRSLLVDVHLLGGAGRGR
jgi:hypothetical protein